MGLRKRGRAWGDLKLECEADKEFGVGRVVKVRKRGGGVTSYLVYTSLHSNHFKTYRVCPTTERSETSHDRQSIILKPTKFIHSLNSP
jgi:hypothetical protein